MASILSYFTPQNKRKRDTLSLSSTESSADRKREKYSMDSSHSPQSPLSPSLLLQAKEHPVDIPHLIAPAKTEAEVAVLVAYEVSKALEISLADMKTNLNKIIIQSIQKVENDLASRISALEHENKLLVTRVAALEADKVMMADSKKHEPDRDMKARLVHLEQYSRKANIRIFGVKESTRENCKQVVADIINDKLQLRYTLSQDDIDAAHRLPQRDTSKPKSIIVRFFRRDDKAEIMRNRRNLKSSGITFGEDLCKDMLGVLNRAENDPRVMNAWAWNGAIFFKDFKEKIHKLEYGVPLDDFNLPIKPVSATSPRP
jgi:hypothetical protein